MLQRSIAIYTATGVLQLVALKHSTVASTSSTGVQGIKQHYVELGILCNLALDLKLLL